jgi:hypothetical protein
LKPKIINIGMGNRGEQKEGTGFPVSLSPPRGNVEEAFFRFANDQRYDIGPDRLQKKYGVFPLFGW